MAEFMPHRRIIPDDQNNQIGLTPSDEAKLNTLRKLAQEAFAELDQGHGLEIRSEQHLRK